LRLLQSFPFLDRVGRIGPYIAMSEAMPGRDVPALISRAWQLQQQGRGEEADQLCIEILRSEPGHFGALHMHGLIALERGDADRGIELIRRSLAIAPNQPAAHSNLGNSLLKRGEPLQALQSFDQALRLKSDYVIAWYSRGNALLALERYAEAVASYDRALALQPNHASALANRGRALLELDRAAEAVANFERALQLAGASADLEFGRGEGLAALGRFDEALAAYDRALSQRSDDVAVLISRGSALQSLRRPAEAVADYERALRIDARSSLALNNLGNALLTLRRAPEALRCFDRSLELEPNHPYVHSNRGMALLELQRAHEALASFEAALRRAPAVAATLAGKAHALEELGRYADAAHCFRQLLQVAPAHDFALSNLLNAQWVCCDWAGYDTAVSRLNTLMREDKKVASPLLLLAVSDSLAAQLHCARLYGASSAVPAPQPLSAGGGYRHERIRVAYVSADLREHAVAYLMAGVFERHDRRRFETIALSLNGAQSGAFGERIRAPFDRFEEVGGRTDEQIARRLRELEVDIAVDLMGYTRGFRLGIFAHRAAPVQVNYLGYAGTLGVPYMDYIVADGVVIAAGEERWYVEQVVRLPHCYLPTDDRRVMDPVPERAQVGLPEQGRVFCAFTSGHKINPKMFDLWCRLLRAVPGSVLWLRWGGEAMRANLLREAGDRGVPGDRLIFAAREPSMERHVGRQRLADLYLDTLPYNAHSTACDALCAGVPVLTCAGRSFAGRVATSALRAAGLEELVTHSLEEYESMALELARSPPRLRALKEKLAAHRATMPLFDTERFTRHLESAYVRMWERAEQGLTPAAFSVDPLL
jgi:predicted O-linked N-acetylglucosamine transferase (SPINDLY family)